jgi:transcription factor IIIB subunit 2
MFAGSNSLRTHQDSSEQTRERGHMAIERAGNMQGINLGPNLIEKAKRVFDVALTAKYTKGRRSNCVVAACCYITCRMEQTSHMLIDFADAFSTNVYQIGAVFLQLRRIFLGDNMTMPLVDPGLYMARFADKLDFGAETQKVVQNANRIAQRMNRDWITTGRRPSGICAASLFIAARMNGFNRTIREIVLVVKICEGTLRKRLKEFQNTDSAKLSTSDFETIMLDSAANPPSFSQKRKQQETKGIENDNADDDQELIEEVTRYVQQTELLIPPTFDESLSDLDDDPEIITALAMSDDEQDFKEQLWTAENFDWIQKQSTKQTIKKEPARKVIPS